MKLRNSDKHFAPRQPPYLCVLQQYCMFTLHSFTENFK
jgi:hypothetical protein